MRRLSMETLILLAPATVIVLVSIALQFLLPLTTPWIVFRVVEPLIAIFVIMFATRMALRVGLIGRARYEADRRDR